MLMALTCLFCSLLYLGYVICVESLKTSAQKVEAIQRCSLPKMFLICESFKGLVNYYGKFIPKMAEVAYSLNHAASSRKCELELEGGGEKRHAK